jgi:hypothetical protein
MTAPLDLPSSHYLLLLAIDLGDQLDVCDGQLALTCEGVEGPQVIPSLPEALDALESRGWVEITEAGPVSTERGRYWMSRWMTRRLGRGRITNLKLVNCGSVLQRD